MNLSDIHLSTRLLSDFIKLHEDFFRGGFAPVFAYRHQTGLLACLVFVMVMLHASLHFLQKA